ncbi:MAG: tetratricopeptide repeat protein [Methanoculleus sp.]|jgi:tetratricopeptide (TPR) repeat protein
MLEYIIELKQAIVTGNYLRIVWVYLSILLAVGITQRKTLILPKYRLKYLVFCLLSITALALWALGLLTWPTSGLMLLLLVALAVVFAHSSRGSLIWPCSLILHDVSSHIEANEPEKAEQILHRYKWCFLDPTEKYSYHLKQAVIASTKDDVRRAIELLDRIDISTLNSDEKTSFELLRAGYFTRLGDHKKALQIIERFSNPSDKYSLQISLIRALAAEFEGNLTKSSEILLDAITIASDRSVNSDYLGALNNLGRIRKIEGNYTDSLNYYRKALELAKRLDDKPSMHIAYQNVIHTLVLLHKQDEVRRLISEYKSMVDFANPCDLLEYYNFLVEYYRQSNNRNKLFEVIDEGRERIYPLISRKEQIVCDISQLRMRWNGGVLSPAFLYQIEDQYPEYANLPAVEQFRCYMEIHHVLQRLKEGGALTLSQEDLFARNRENIRSLVPALEDHLCTIPEYCVFEKCQVIWDIIRGKKCGTDDYDKKEVLLMLEDIKEIHLMHGNFIEALKAGLDVSDEALGQKQYEKMWEYTQLAMDELQEIQGHPAEIPAFIQIACYAYGAGEHDLAREYLDRFECTGEHISHYADWIQGYYIGLKQERGSNA